MIPKFSKKAQITIFIIIGIIIMFSSALVFYIRVQVREQEIQTFEEPLLEEVPAEIAPIQNYVTECIKRVARDGLVLMGEQGGWIYPQNIKMTDDFTESDGINFSGVIPYWHYLSSSNDCSGDCEFSSLRPTISRSVDPFNSMEAQLDKYVNENLITCLNNFESFKEIGFEVEYENVDTISAIDNDVKFILNFPVTISKGSTTIELKKFYYKEKLELRKMYNLATELTNAEQEKHFLEKNTIEIMSIFMGLNKNKLPPLYAMELKISKVFWLVNDVKVMLEELMMNYINFMQVYLSANYNRLDYDDGSIIGGITQRFYDNMIVDIQGFGDFNVDFMYFNNWGSYLQMNGGRSYTTSDTSSMGFFLIQMSMSQYKNFYDFSYPVMVRIDDVDAFEGKGYTFAIALESNLRSNKALNSTYKKLLTGYKPTEKSIYCDTDNYQSGELTLRVRNAYNGHFIEDAAVVFNAGEACTLSQTDENGTIKTKMPIGVGELQVMKDGYLTRTVKYISTKEEQTLTITLEPPRDIKIEMKNIEFNKDINTWVADEEPSPFYVDQYAFLTFDRLDDDGSDDYTTIALFYGNETELPEVRLYAGKYEVTGTTMRNKEIVFQPHKRTYDKGLFDEGEYYIPPETIYFGPPALVGGLELNEKNANWQLLRDDLFNNNKIIFKIIEIDLVELFDPDIEYDLEQVGKLNEYYTQLRSRLEPELVKIDDGSLI